MEEVILVDENDNAIGTMEKMEAHRKGALHRAFSILIFNSKGQLLLQKRSWKKYHSGGLWTNTCCSHPKPDEDIEQAMRRKLIQEMGIDVKPHFSHKFIYRTELENNLTEHEYDHVYVGRYDGEPEINHDEVDEWRFEDMGQLRAAVAKKPQDFTYWFRLILDHPELKAA
ncbi:MAG TPA: isopentenyl-diphosphate Delta-isomerase [Cyclobacteriaceae bacterium]|nr:isopentenyl-diphosphate Delta-isomerase [Cyclobacteriaceae bacterium]